VIKVLLLLNLIKNVKKIALKFVRILMMYALMEKIV